MRGPTSFALAALAMSSVAQAATVYLAGDSTMAAKGANDGSTDGWGQYLSKYITLSVVNNAVGGRSARSFTREGRFTAIANLVKSGDFVVIEFGHNDGGSLSTDNGRTDCPGTGSETCQTTYNGVAETVLTFNAYIKNAAKLMQSKGATVIISSQTPNNPCEGGTCAAATGPRFVGYAKDSAAATGSGYVDHWQYVYNMDIKIGSAATNAFYPKDHTHTSPAGADAYAQAFVKGLSCSSISLKSSINAAGNAVNVGNCVGGSATPTTATTKPPTSTGGTAAHYAQCGGIGYTGPTVCVSPYVCTYSNEYYSQCL